MTENLVAAERLTGRLRLVPIGVDHVDDLVTVHSDPWVAHWFADALTTADQAIGYANGWSRAWEELGVGKWMAYLRETGELVGRGGPSRMIQESPVAAQIARLVGPDWSPLRVEMGWALRAPYRGRGYATEIATEALDLAFGSLGAGVVIAYTERHNLASRAVMERVGMALAGEIRASGLVEGLQGEQADAPFAVYAITASDRQTRQPPARPS